MVENQGKKLFFMVENQGKEDDSFNRRTQKQLLCYPCQVIKRKKIGRVELIP